MLLWIAGYVLVNISIFLFMKFIKCKDQIKIKDDVELKKKYWPYFRDDIFHIDIIYDMPWILTAIPRFIFGWIMII